MNTITVTYERAAPPYLFRRVVHAPAGISDLRARRSVFGFRAGFDRIERERFIFEAVGKPRDEAAA